MNVTAEATADVVDVDELLALVSAFAGHSSSPPESPGRSTRVFARVSAPRARAAGVELTQFYATMIAEVVQTAIDPFSFDGFGGRHDGWLDAQIVETMQVRAGAANVDMARLAAFAGAPGAMTGRLTGSGRFGARGRDVGSILASMRGVGQGVITDGLVRGMDIVQTVVQPLGGPGAAPAPAGGERFTDMVGTFALSDGTLRSDDFTLRSPDYDLFARGTLALGSTTLDARVDLVLSDALSAKAGRDVYRYARTGKRIVLSARIDGTLAQPRIHIDMAVAVRRGTLNEIERRLESLLEQVRPF